MKLYLLDANVLITANRDYYSMEMVPVFWEWLLHMAEQGHVKMPIETLEEVRDGGGKVKKDALVTWLNRADVYEKLVLREDVDRIKSDPVALTILSLRVRKTLRRVKIPQIQAVTRNEIKVSPTAVAGADNSRPHMRSHPSCRVRAREPVATERDAVLPAHRRNGRDK